MRYSCRPWNFHGRIGYKLCDDLHDIFSVVLCVSHLRKISLLELKKSPENKLVPVVYGINPKTNSKSSSKIKLQWQTESVSKSIKHMYKNIYWISCSIRINRCSKYKVFCEYRKLFTKLPEERAHRVNLRWPFHEGYRNIMSCPCLPFTQYLSE